ncbi:tumor necrosis factor ligand superfamily member 8 [Sceloporus undulatus]|uniref:tumor necrosis factor ligand superfamily member 8 n=1 Tax=Sceloporus undulatus TaxID=8520 RepID=UPI001C4A9984|nr:tumor necrosis factor ligand superfamily member 8 [Sceloporus undulatus]
MADKQLKKKCQWSMKKRIDGLYKGTNSPPEKKSFFRVNRPQEGFKDMTEEGVARPFHPKIQAYLYFFTVSLTLCLLAALGIIVALVLQRTGSTAECDGHRRAEMQGAASMSPQTMASEKAAAYLQVSQPINQSRLRWHKEGILHNFQYDNGNLVVQEPGTYFIYCHLQFYIPKCGSTMSELRLGLLINSTIRKETVLTLCSSHKTSEGISHDLSSVLLVELKKGDWIEVEVDPFIYLDTGTFPTSNVLGVLKYTGEDWKCPFLGTIAGQCL